MSSASSREDYEVSTHGGSVSIEGSTSSQLKRFLKELVWGRAGGPRRLSKNESFTGSSMAMSTVDKGDDNDSRRGGGSYSSKHITGYIPKSRWIISFDNGYYQLWGQFMLACSAYSAVITPFEFSFFRRLPHSLVWSDVAINFFFVIQMILNFFVAYKDKKTYTIMEDHRQIAIRYLTGYFPWEFLALMPWDSFYKAAGGHGGAEVLRWMLWVRVFRFRHILSFMKRLEKDIRLNYFVTRIVSLLLDEFYATHVAGCFFYYLATTIPSENEADTWIGSLTLGGNSYANFRDLDLGKRYVTALYWAIVTMATLGYGDIHAVNPREMVFIMIFVSFDMLLGAYLLGNMTALVVKGSSTERYRDKMASLVKYMNRNHLPSGLRHQMRHHLRLQFETDQIEDDILENFPISIRHKVSRALYRSVVQDSYLFNGCSHEFVNQIVSRSAQETYMPQEVVLQQRDAADNFFVVVDGVLEEVEVGRDGSEDIIATHSKHSVIGEVALLCSIPQPFTVRVKDVAHLLRIEKQSFNNVISSYVMDGRQVVDNLLQKTKDGDSKVAALASEITNLIGQQEAELIMTTINAASRGDLEHLKSLIKAGANPMKADYDGRTPLHLAASKGFDEVVRFLLAEGVDVNIRDNFGTTPMLEALRSSHTSTADILQAHGATVALQEAGTDLCNAVMAGHTEYLQRLLNSGVDPNSADYDMRAPIHIAASEGMFQTVAILIDSGADVFVRDRWGNTALDEAQRCGSVQTVKLLEEAMVRKTGGTAMNAAAPSVPLSKEFLSGRDSSTTTTLSLAAAAMEVQADEGSVAASPGGLMTITSEPSSPKVEKASTSVRDNVMSALGSGVVTPRHAMFSPRSRRFMGKGFRSDSYTTDAIRKRVTLYPYHPWIAKRKPGRLVWVPPTIKDLLLLAEKHFGGAYTRILNMDGGEVPTIDLILDGDRLYAVDGEDPEEGAAGLG